MACSPRGLVAGRGGPAYTRGVTFDPQTITVTLDRVKVPDPVLRLRGHAALDWQGQPMIEVVVVLRDKPADPVQGATLYNWAELQPIHEQILSELRPHGVEPHLVYMLDSEARQIAAGTYGEDDRAANIA